MKERVGAMNGKRLDYFKGVLPTCPTNHMRRTMPIILLGKAAVKALLSPAFAKIKGVPKVTSESEADLVLKNVNAYAYFLHVQRGDRGAPTGNSSSSPKALNIIPEQMFSSEEYYAWFYEGSQWTTYAGGVLMVIIMLAGVMFPLWCFLIPLSSIPSPFQ